MSNSFFDFKQFRISQANAAMKVSSDACIQGAWTPVKNEIQQVADVGAGTGLLSMMLAQRLATARFDAFEIDEGAVRDARENVASSAFKHRIDIHHADARSYAFEKKYRLLICNPPFFKNSLQSPDAARNAARHEGSFSLEDLMTAMRQCLVDGGYASVLLPFRDVARWRTLLQENGWGIKRQLCILPKKEAQPNRAVCICEANFMAETAMEYLCIKEEDGTYTTAFKGLMDGYYL